MSSVRTRAKRANTVPSASSEKAASQKQTFNSNLSLISAYLKHLVCLVTIYSEDEPGIRSTLDSIAVTQYPDSHKLILAICDGLVTGSGNSRSTPGIVLSMMESFQRPFEDSNVSSYIAVASGIKRNNMAKIYCGYYKHDCATVDPKNWGRVPMICIVKCGLPQERLNNPKPGNRGKRDSQIILMRFLQRVMFNERMYDLENELYYGIWRLCGVRPESYEAVLMVDADTKIYEDSISHMMACFIRDPRIMGLCGETRISNKRESWVTMIQVFEYFISHHLTKSFESVFGGVTCLPGCFCMYRIKVCVGQSNFWVPLLANPDIIERYSVNHVETLHCKNLLLLGEDRYLSTLLLKTFPHRKQVFVPQAKCKTMVPSEFRVLVDQRRRWINSTIHNLMELILVRDLYGVFCISMQFVVFIEFLGTVTLPAAMVFTVYLIVISIFKPPIPVTPIVLLCVILGIPAVLIVITAHKWIYLIWMMIYLCSLPVWNFILPLNACRILFLL